MNNKTIQLSDFAKIDIRAGEIVRAEEFPEARKPAYRLVVDCGPDLGRRRSSAQITDLYRPADLIGRMVAVVVNLPPRQVGPTLSEVLVLGFPDVEGRVVLVRPDSAVPPGARLY